MTNNNMQSREAALKALNQISSDEASAEVLIEIGILPAFVKDLFTVGANQLPIWLKEDLATILANFVNSGHAFDSIPVGPDNLTLVSAEIIHSLLHLISNTGPAIERKLLQVLFGLTSSPTTELGVISGIKSSGATISLVQFIEAPQRELRTASIKLLQNLAPHMGSELAGCLRVTSGQLGSLMMVIFENTGITEEHAAAARFLADLPGWDTGLIRQNLDEGAFQLLISRIIWIQQGEMRGSRFMTPSVDGLVKILARITFVLSEDTRAALALCQNNNLESLFIDLLQANGPMGWNKYI